MRTSSWAWAAWLLGADRLLLDESFLAAGHETLLQGASRGGTQEARHEPHAYGCGMLLPGKSCVQNVSCVARTWLRGMQGSRTRDANWLRGMGDSRVRGLN